MASLAEMVPEVSPVWGATALTAPRDEVEDLTRAEWPHHLDRRLVAVCRERGPLQAVAALVAWRLVDLEAWERLGFARLGDYAAECLGCSARKVRDMARVGGVLAGRPRLYAALVSGELGWTKVRLLARLPPEEDVESWIAAARRVTADALSQRVRAVDRGSIEGGALDEESRSRLFAVRCTPEVRALWNVSRGAARRVAGRMLHPSEAAELVAAEVLSALPLDEGAGDGPGGEVGHSWNAACEAASETERPGGEESAPRRPDLGDTPAAGGENERRDATSPETGRATLPRALQPLVAGLDGADAFALDQRLQQALGMELRLEARVGPLLAAAWERFVHRATGHRTREAYTRDRLGMDPTRARALVRLERMASQSPAFDRAYRTGALSWVKAGVLGPLVRAEPLGPFVDDWVGWAGRVTVRRLRDDVEAALTRRETDPAAFARDGGLPPEARDREIGAAPKEGEEDGAPLAALLKDADTDADGESASETTGDREIGAARRELSRTLEAYDTPDALAAWPFRRPPPRSTPRETCSARFMGPPEVVRLFQAVLSTVRRRMEKDIGRLPTEGEALGAMLEHALSSWGEFDQKLVRRHRVFARDGWRCATPGCTSMQNLHDHHIRFRSAGGSDDLENRVTLCAFHHLRGVHGGLLRCTGRAPDGLRWEMGVRSGVSPRWSYRSGDVRVATA